MQIKEWYYVRFFCYKHHQKLYQMQKYAHKTYENLRLELFLLVYTSKSEPQLFLFCS